MRLKFLVEDDVCLQVAVEGRVTQEDVMAHREPIAEMFGPGVYARRLLVDLEQASYLDSSGIGWLLKCHKRFQDAGGRMVLHSISPLVMQVLNVLRMDQVLLLAKDATAARQLAQGDAA